MMEIFDGYVLQSQLTKKANVSTSAFSQMQLDKKTMGGLKCLKVSSLPKKYQSIAKKQCIDLKYYCSFSYLSLELAMNIDFLNDMERYKNFEYVRVGKNKLFKLSQEFIDHVKKGFTPFKIRKDSQTTDLDLAQHVIEMQGLKIGFY